MEMIILAAYGKKKNKKTHIYNVTLFLPIKELANTHCPLIKQTYSSFPNKIGQIPASNIGKIASTQGLLQSQFYSLYK